jgi:hypothetical protein
MCLGNDGSSNPRTNMHTENILPSKVVTKWHECHTIRRVCVVSSSFGCRVWDGACRANGLGDKNDTWFHTV